MKEQNGSGTSDEDLIYRNNRELFYSFDENGNYTKRVGYQYSANQVIIKQSWEVAEERINNVIQKIKEGELSPLAYYMEKHLMELPTLADYSGFMKWRVKRHLKPKVFSKLKPNVILNYASIFDVTPEELVTPGFLVK